jgi:hypothetical protein
VWREETRKSGESRWLSGGKPYSGATGEDGKGVEQGGEGPASCCNVGMLRGVGDKGEGAPLRLRTVPQADDPERE